MSPPYSVLSFPHTPFATLPIIPSFGSFTFLEVVQSVTNVAHALEPIISSLATNAYDIAIGHKALSQGQTHESLAFVPMQACDS